MKRIIHFTGTLTESQDLGMIICRIFGMLNMRTLDAVETYKGIKKCFLSGKDADLKLLFYSCNGRPFSKYVNSKEMDNKIKEYFKNFFKWAKQSEEVKSKKVYTSVNNQETEDNDLPF